MLDGALKRLVDSPRLYDLLQWLVGDREIRRRLESYTGAASQRGWVVDVGGGTGLGVAPRGGSHYVCLDIDVGKLQRFRTKNRRGLAVAGNAVHCPLRSGSVDLVVCAKVTHHLNDGELDAVLGEAARLLKEGGSLVLADALQSDRWVARLLWRLDRGSYPRTKDALMHALRAVFITTHWDGFRASIFHDFVVCVARKAPAAPGGAAGPQPRRPFSESA